MTNHTKTTPQIPADRIPGYMAMARPLVSMWEIPAYDDPAGVNDFRELITRVVPHKPGFLQLALWFLDTHGPIKLAKNKKGEVVMADEQQKIDWKRFVMDRAEHRMPVHSRKTYYFDEDQSEDRQDHLNELVQGSQYLFKYRAADAQTSVKFGVTVRYEAREYGKDEVRYGKGGF